MRQVAIVPDAGIILARAVELHLQIDLIDNDLAILNCDRTAIVHRIAVGPNLARGLLRHLNDRDALSYLYRVINRVPPSDVTLRENAKGIAWSGLSGS